MFLLYPSPLKQFVILVELITLKLICSLCSPTATRWHY